jgi:NADPH-dependent glutamate synthase beta subunit-like oxidoreductase
VFSANEFLTRVNLMGGDQFPYRDTPIGLGDNVVVIGGGNTAMDCLRVARRLGVASVRCVYRRTEAEAPARVEELRHAREEGVEFSFLHAPDAILVDDAGNVRALRQIGVAYVVPRRHHVAVVEGDRQVGRVREYESHAHCVGQRERGHDLRPSVTRVTESMQPDHGGIGIGRGLDFDRGKQLGHDNVIHSVRRALKKLEVLGVD